MIIDDIELKQIIGGVSATLINSVVRALEFIFELGKNIGSIIRRRIDGTKC